MNIEPVLISYFKGKGYDCKKRRPEPAPDELLTLQVTGASNYSVVVHKPLVALQVWAKTDKRAAELAEEIRELVIDEINGIRSISGVDAVSLNGPYDFFDVETRTPRYQMVLDITTTY